MKFIIPILSLIISVIALAVALPRPNNLGFDYLGVIVAIISLATAFAVGFQIWNALSLEKRLKELEAKIEADNTVKINSLKQKLTAQSKKLSLHLTALILHKTAFATATILATNDLYDDSFFYLAESLNYKIVLPNKFAKTLVEPSEAIMLALINGDYNIHITDPKKQDYIIKTIINSKNKELIQKIETIKNKMFALQNNP